MYKQECDGESPVTGLKGIGEQAVQSQVESGIAMLECTIQ